MRKNKLNNVAKRNEGGHFKSVMRVICGTVLGVVILYGQKGNFQPVYGSDAYSGYGGFDTGGFDMDIGEGTGQFPDNWDSANSRDGNRTDDSGSYTDYEDYGESGNAAGNSGQESDWTMDNDKWQGSTTQWGYEQTGTGDYYESDNGSVSFGNTEDAGDGGREDRNEGTGNVDDGRSGHSAGSDGEAAAGTKESSPETAAAQASEDQPSADRSGSTSVPGISSSPTPVPTEKTEKTKMPTPAGKMSASPVISPDSGKRQKLALSYYQTEEKAVSSSDEEKPPEFTAEIQDSHICLTIKQGTGETPVQILSFRINEKECTWHWQGGKLTAEIPGKISGIKKAELLLYMSSGRLYHEIMELL